MFTRMDAEGCLRAYGDDRARAVRRIARVRLAVHGGLKQQKASGGDALRGDTRTHPEHDG